MPVHSSKESPSFFLCTSLLTPPITLPKKVLPGCTSISILQFLYVHHVHDMVRKLSSPCSRVTTFYYITSGESSTCRVYAINIFHRLTNIIVLRVWYITQYIHRWVGIPHDLGIHEFQQLANQLLPPHILCVCVCVVGIYINVGGHELRG